MNIWTSFWDMHSGGGSKEKWEMILIEAPQAEAEIIFYNRFGHNPHRVSCTCCGNDYTVGEGTLLEVTGYHRGCAYGEDGYVEEPSKEKWANKYRTIEEYKRDPEVLFIPATEVRPEERLGELPEQGYVWVG